MKRVSCSRGGTGEKRLTGASESARRAAGESKEAARGKGRDRAQWPRRGPQTFPACPQICRYRP